MTLLPPELLPTLTYPFATLRYQQQQLPMQEGVTNPVFGGVSGTGLQVTQRAAGADRSVDVAFGNAWIQGDDAGRQGIYHQINDNPVNVVIAANSSGNPRLDQIVLQMADSSVIGSSDTPTLIVVQGTPNASATLASRAGAAALPNTALRLADVIVANGAATIVNANIRDRRTWAAGLKARIVRKAGDYVTAAANSWVSLDATNVQLRVECSGLPLKVKAIGWAACAGSLYGRPTVNGSGIDGLENTAATGAQARLQAGNALGGFSQEFEIDPGAGSALIGYQVKGDGTNAGTLFADGSTPFYLIVEEVRPNANNGTS